MKTKEEIKNEIAKRNNFDSFERAIRYTFNRELLHSEKVFINKLFNEAMEFYAQERTKDLFPREFIEWLIKNYECDSDDGLLYRYDGEVWRPHTLDEVFTYWKEQIK